MDETRIPFVLTNHGSVRINHGDITPAEEPERASAVLQAEKFKLSVTERLDVGGGCRKSDRRFE